MIELLPSKTSDKYGIIIWARTLFNKEVKVLETLLDLEEFDYVTLKLSVLSYKKSFKEKLFKELLLNESLDPRDELLEDPKNE